METLIAHRSCLTADSSSEMKSDFKKNSKPHMEKRRRAKINSCLDELKDLILAALKKDPARHNKLEKADILEMTVRHLQHVQRQRLAQAVSADPSVLTKFKNGFVECAQEVDRYVKRIEGVDCGVEQRLLCHVDHCVSNLERMSPLTFATVTSPVPLNMWPIQCLPPSSADSHAMPWPLPHSLSTSTAPDSTHQDVGSANDDDRVRKPVSSITSERFSAFRRVEKRTISSKTTTSTIIPHSSTQTPLLRPTPVNLLAQADCSSSGIETTPPSPKRARLDSPICDTWSVASLKPFGASPANDSSIDPDSSTTAPGSEFLSTSSELDRCSELSKRNSQLPERSSELPNAKSCKKELNFTSNNNSDHGTKSELSNKCMWRPW